MVIKTDTLTNSNSLKYRILITGVSGFIGSCLYEYFSNKGYEVLGIDCKQPNQLGKIKLWRKIDITKYDELLNCISSFSPDFILHLAARTDLNGKTLNDYSANTIGTENLIKVANSIENIKSVIFTSSMLVCGPGYMPKHPLDYRPTTVYGESKVEMERIIRKYSHHYTWAIVRPTSIWGPGFGTPYRDFFDLVVKHSYFHIGNKASTKTYGYVGNVIYQIDSILNTSPDKINEQVFYLGEYVPTNIKIWADEIAEQLQYKIKTIPFSIIKCAALTGDLMKFIGISFPMSSFRLKNMTTDNVVDLSNTMRIAPQLPYTRVEGIKKTLDWLKDRK